MCAPVRFTGENFRRKPHKNQAERLKQLMKMKGVAYDREQTEHHPRNAAPDCVTEIRMGNSVLVVSGFFKKGTTDTAADKMMKVLEAEAATGKNGDLTALKEAAF